MALIVRPLIPFGGKGRREKGESEFEMGRPPVGEKRKGGGKKPKGSRSVLSIVAT